MTELIIRIDMNSARFEPTADLSTKDLILQRIQQLFEPGACYDAIGGDDSTVCPMDGIVIELASCPCVIIAGNVIDGLQLLGPFADPEIANAYGDHHVHDSAGSWLVANLTTPVAVEA